MTFSTRTTDEIIALLPAALEQGDRRDVNALVGALLERKASLGRQWRTVAIVLSQKGEHRAAIAAIRLFVEAEGRTSAALMEEVRILRLGGRISEARAALAHLPNSVPDPATHAYLLGTFDSMIGDLALARAELEEATQLTADAGLSWLALAAADTVPADSGIGDRVIANDPRRTGRKMRNADAYFYALGKILSDRDDHAAAFDAVSEAARQAAAQQRPYSAVSEAAFVKRIATGFDRPFIDRVAATVTIDTSRPIIVTGNPRSGTTLVEQILASHSAVGDGAELEIMRVIGEEIGGPTENDLSRYLGTRDADSLAELYLHLLDERFEKGGRIVDKRLTASRTLGILAAILPEAPLIWLQRDPLDSAWSCFRTCFVNAVPWTNSLDGIAGHFRIEDAMLAMWQDRLGDRLLVVPYESLVDDPTRWTRQLLDHCGLAEEPGVFAPHESERPVMSASMIQVRKPINRAGIGSAAPYRTYLQPFIDAYGYEG